MNANENASEARAKQVALDTKDRLNRKGRERAEKGESGAEKTGRGELSFQGVSFMHKRERRSSRQTHHHRTGKEIRKTHTHTGRSGAEGRTHRRASKTPSPNPTSQDAPSPQATAGQQDTAGRGPVFQPPPPLPTSHFLPGPRSVKADDLAPALPQQELPLPTPSLLPGLLPLNIFNRRQPLLQVLRKIALMKS